LSVRIIAFDLDDVLCSRPITATGDIEKYKSCKPIQPMVEFCNERYDSGDKIVIYTARGMSTQKGNVSKVYSKLYSLTSLQLKEWGVKYHELVMGKIHYDFLIDDKAINYNGHNLDKIKKELEK
tara:strand:- start:284 stop:655 length:372 start_codon:yes stop_codon:yes gene_type:complete